MISIIFNPLLQGNVLLNLNFTKDKNKYFFNKIASLFLKFDELLKSADQHHFIPHSKLPQQRKRHHHHNAKKDLQW